MRTILIIVISVLLTRCSGKYEETDSHAQTGQKKTATVYWEPIHYDTLKASIKDRITFSGDDTIKYLPSDRDLTLTFDFLGKMKEYMKYGKMIVRPYDSSVFVNRINNHTFKLRVYKPIEGWKISMYYELSFERPFRFSYIYDSILYRVEPNDTMLLFIRSEMTKPGAPWDYY